MPKAELEETQEVQENFLQEDLHLVPRFLKRLWTNNFIQRTIAYLQAKDPDGKHIFLRCTTDGRLPVSVEAPGKTTGTTTQVTVTTSATLLISTNLLRLDVLIMNDSGRNVYIGFTDTVSTTTGFCLRDGVSWGSDTYKGPLYAIVAADTATMDVMEI